MRILFCHENFFVNPCQQKKRISLNHPERGQCTLLLKPGNATITVDYVTLVKTIAALTEGYFNPNALMATEACEAHHFDDRFDWTRSYCVTDPEFLMIVPNQGKYGCQMFPSNRGACGAVARTGEVQHVPDVDAFPGHISCAATTRSRLVLSVRKATDEVIAVFDVYSDQPDFFA